MSRSRKCAYCHKENKLTREHIWPKCLIVKMPELQLKYLRSQNIFTTSELVITDVCADCNNNKLSIVDSYFCLLYDKYFKFFHDEKVSFELEYDYDLLLRSLLKITFNSSRTVNRENNIFEKYREMILCGNIIREDIIVKLDIITPYKLNDQNIYPNSARCGDVRLANETRNFIVRGVAVNSFYFYIILSKEEEISSDLKDELIQVFIDVPGTLVHPYMTKVLIDTFSSQDAQSIHSDFISNSSNLHSAYKKNKRS